MTQLSLFDGIDAFEKALGRIKVLSLFSGIGAFEKALVKLGVAFDLVSYCEIDKYASKSYSAIHGVDESLNLGDITKVDEKELPKDIDLITYGFPCQDISLAGKQKGLFNEDGSQTRSGLFFEALRIIESTQPRIAIAENVKNLTSKRFNAQFQVVLASLDEAGYNNYWAVLNAKDYGIPQNRERVFIISIRKDIDNSLFEFPKPFPLEKRLKDMLEAVVDEKYYLSDNRIDNLIRHKERNAEKGNGFGAKFVTGDDVSCSITTSPEKSSGQYLFVVGTLTTDGSSPKHNNRVVVPTVKELIKENNKNVKHQRDLLQHHDDICRCIPAGTHGSTPHLTKTVVAENPLRIRKLTPKECFRLMGFSDEDFARAEVVNSNTQLYKQAGNSIVVDVLQYIFQSLIKCGAMGGEINAIY